MIEFEYIKDIIIKNKFAIIGFLIGLLSIIGSVTFVLLNREKEIVTESSNINETLSKVEESTTDITIAKIKVDVKGAVKKAGVYEFELNSTIEDAIKAAGGITSRGTTTNINLSKKLADEMVVYIFSKDELKKKETANELVCEIPKCECETIKIEECPSTVNGNNNQTDKTTTNTEETPSNTTENKISINKASIEEFTTLDGIGESKAQAIIDYRQKNGPFEKIEDIMNVSGIGEKAFEKIKDKLTL